MVGIWDTTISSSGNFCPCLTNLKVSIASIGMGSDTSRSRAGSKPALQPRRCKLSPAMHRYKSPWTDMAIYSQATITGRRWTRSPGAYSHDRRVVSHCSNSASAGKEGEPRSNLRTFLVKLTAHPAVIEAAVVGASDENGLTKPKAYCVLREAGRPHRDVRTYHSVAGTTPTGENASSTSVPNEGSAE
jgi:hypothetical protein